MKDFDAMKDFPEVGYTPENLRYLIKQTGLSQAKFAEKYNVPLSSLKKYINGSDTRLHYDMPWKKWRELLAVVSQ